MADYHQSGKALLMVEKDGDTLYATAIPLTGLQTNGEFQWFDDVMQNAVYCDWLPDQCKRLKNRDKVTFKVTFEQNYYKGDGYTTDDDEELIFNTAVKIRHKRGVNESRRSLKKYYRTKGKKK